MKKLTSLLLTLAMLLALCACGSAPANNANTTADNNASSPAAPENNASSDTPAQTPEFVLTFSDYNPENSLIGDVEREAMAKIEADSNGRIKFEPYFSGTLLEAMDTWSGTATGLADISYYFITLSTGVQTAGEVFTQYHTFSAPADTRNTQLAYREALESIPEIQAEANAANLMILDVYATPPAVYLFGKEQNISTPEDTRGMIFQSQGHYSEALQTVGASGESLYPADWYTSLERGVVDALTMNWNGMRDFGLTDISNYYLTFGENTGLYNGGAAYIMNLDAWNSLPEDLQQIVREGFQYLSDTLVARDYENCLEVEQEEKDAGKTMANIPESEMQPWYDLAQIAVDGWIADCNARGQDGQAIYDKYVEIMSSHR